MVVSLIFNIEARSRSQLGYEYLGSEDEALWLENGHELNWMNMTDSLKNSFKFPPEQQAIRDRCFHPSGTLAEFPIEEVESSIPARFEKIAKCSSSLGLACTTTSSIWADTHCWLRKSFRASVALFPLSSRCAPYLNRLRLPRWRPSSCRTKESRLAMKH